MNSEPLILNSEQFPNVLYRYIYYVVLLVALLLVFLVSLKHYNSIVQLNLHPNSTQFSLCKCNIQLTLTIVIIYDISHTIHLTHIWPYQQHPPYHQIVKERLTCLFWPYNQKEVIPECITDCIQTASAPSEYLKAILWYQGIEAPLCPKWRAFSVWVFIDQVDPYAPGWWDDDVKI